jgi:hypothetical protein
LEGRARVTATGAVDAIGATMVIIISSHSRALL